MNAIAPLAFKPSPTPTTSVGAALVDQPPFTDKEIADGVMQIIQSRPEVKEALATRLADELNTSMYGRAIQDRVFPETHEHATMYISPYARPGAGAAAFVTYTDTNTGEVYVLLGLKPNGELVPPGGYMEPHDPEGGNPNKPSDFNLMETSRRELEEETGLHVDKSYKPDSLGTNSDYGIANDPRLHTIVEGFHYSLFGPMEKMPKVEGKDDIQAAVWVKASDIQASRPLTTSPQETQGAKYSVKMGEKTLPIKEQYGHGVELAVLRARKMLQNGAARMTQVPVHSEAAPQQHTANQPQRRDGKSWAEFVTSQDKTQSGPYLH